VPHDQFDGRPVIGICNTFSELTPCNSHFRTLAEQVKIGVYEAGGFPLEFPVMSLGETLLRPTAMLYRNLASMDVEESIRGNPIDGVVLLMGCDKTTPSLLMGASSVDLPTIGVSGGPMLNGKWRGQELGGHRRVEHERAGARRHAEAGRLLRGRELHAPQPRPLHDHGHRQHHGQHGRGARHRPARQRRLPGGGRPPQRAGAQRRAAHRRDGARRPEALAHPDARGLRERHQARWPPSAAAPTR
jgi:L-arabonate dehydrase